MYRYVFILALAVSAGPLANNGKAERKAVLCAASDYSKSTLKVFSNLEGPKNDVKLLEYALIHKYNFEPGNVTVLGLEERADRRATRKNILRGLKSLVDGAKPGDWLVFSFHGHGFQQVNTNANIDKSEDDGLDEIFCPVDIGSFDVDTGTFNNAIVDDEIYDIVRNVKNKGATMIFVADSCHSGTVARLIDLEDEESPPPDPNVRLRGMLQLSKSRGISSIDGLLALNSEEDPDNVVGRLLAPDLTQEDFLSKLKKLQVRVESASRSTSVAESSLIQGAQNVIAFYAASPEQPTIERKFSIDKSLRSALPPSTKVSQKHWCGAFTYTFVRHLLQNPKATPLELMERVRKTYTDQKWNVRPDFAADTKSRLLDLPMFGETVDEEYGLSDEAEGDSEEESNLTSEPAVTRPGKPKVPSGPYPFTEVVPYQVPLPTCPLNKPPCHLRPKIPAK